MQDTQKERLNQLMDAEIAKLRLQVEGQLSGYTSIAKVEKALLRSVFELCLVLLKFILTAKSEEDLSSEISPLEEEKIVPSGRRKRRYMSLFGTLEYERQSYYSKQRGLLYPLDDKLSIPKNLLSYNIQEVMGQGACEVSFRESTHVLTSLLGLPLCGMDSERNVDQLGQHVDAFYDQQSISVPSEAHCFSASFDGKGVPKIKAVNEDPAPASSRLKKGEKRGKKQMATVVVTSVFKPKVRDKSVIINSLMNIKQAKKADGQEKVKNDNRWHEDIHRRAFLADQEKAIEYGLGRIKKQITSPNQRLVIPLDAGSGLEDRVMECIKKMNLEDNFEAIILDIVHVSEYVWECANAILGGKSTERSQWVAKKLGELLDSKVEHLIAELQTTVDGATLSGSRNKRILKAITYFSNHMHKMNYKVYLEKGYPVSSALVESNCKHLVKDRMEGSGMRWSDKGAQNMMDLRAVKLNGQMTELMDFVVQQNKKICAPLAA